MDTKSTESAKLREEEAFQPPMDADRLQTEQLGEFLERSRYFPVFASPSRPMETDDARRLLAGSKV